MAPGPGVCDNCGKPARERSQTVTGRRVCQSCADDLDAGGATLLIGGSVPEAIAIRGWRQRVRQWRDQDRPKRP